MKLRPSRAGAALVTVLGVLTVITILAVSFTLVMRLESTSARRYADRARALHYTEVGLVRALETVSAAMLDYHAPYPVWGTRSPSSWGHAYASVSTNVMPFLPNSTNLFTGYVTNLIPAALHADIRQVTSSWIHVIGVDPRNGENTSTNGRVAYLAVNLSGLLDANALTVTSGTAHATATGVIDPEWIAELWDPDLFLADRELHTRYETLAELNALNHGLTPPASNLFVYSYDPNPGVYMADTNRFGFRNAELKPRFDLNAITNHTDLSSAEFRNQYVTPLRDLLEEAGVTNAAETVWNVVAFLEPGHLPVNDRGRNAWREDYGGQAVPLINELSLQQIRHPSINTTNAYRLSVELWYPFVPRVITEQDDYWLHVYAYTEAAPAGMSLLSIVQPGRIKTDWSFSQKIGPMAYGETTEFNVIEAPNDNLITFPVDYEIADGQETTAYLSLGIHHIDDADEPFTVTNHVWILTRITQGSEHTDRDSTIIVDEAMSRDSANLEGNAWALPLFDAPRTYAVTDPRMNTETSNWVVVDSHSLGAINPVSAWAGTNRHQGLPIVHLNGPAGSIVDIGQVHVHGHPWETIDLLDAARGALLLDRLTVTPTNDTPWQSGRVNLNTRHFDVLRSLFVFDRIPQPAGNGSTNAIDLSENALDYLVATIWDPGTNTVWPYRRLSDLFTGPGGDPVAAAMRAVAATNTTGVTDYQHEYPLRYLVDKTTTRENLLGIILAGQALSPEGRSILVDYREFVLVMRDAWTGNWFVKQRFVLEDW